MYTLIVEWEEPNNKNLNKQYNALKCIHIIMFWNRYSMMLQMY